MDSKEALERLIGYIESKKLKPVSSGSTKDCFLTSKYAVLKSKKPINVESSKEILQTYNKFKKIKRLNDLLLSLGIPVNKIYTCTLNNKRYYELQDRVYGRVLYKYNTDMLLKKATTQNLDNLYLSKLEPELKDIIASTIYEYNKETQNILAQAPQEHFDCLLKAMCTLEKEGITNFDNNPENVLYNPENGFNLIDVNLLEMLSQKISNSASTQPPTQFEDAFEIFADIFAESLHFALGEDAVLNKKQITSLQDGNIEIAKKLITAANNNHLKIDISDMGFERIETMVGPKNLKNCMSFIFSDNIQRTTKK